MNEHWGGVVRSPVFWVFDSIANLYILSLIKFDHEPNRSYTLLLYCCNQTALIQLSNLTIGLIQIWLMIISSHYMEWSTGLKSSNLISNFKFSLGTRMSLMILNPSHSLGLDTLKLKYCITPSLLIMNCREEACFLIYRLAIHTETM